MSVWDKPLDLKPSIFPSKISDKEKVNSNNNNLGIIAEEISCGITDFKISPQDRHIYEKCQEIKNKRLYEDMLIWMNYYDSHLKNMYDIFLSSLKKYNIKTRIFFDEFRLYVYRCTVPRLDPYIHKKVRPLI